MTTSNKIDFDTFAFNIGVQAGQTRDASKPLHDAYTKATPEQQADLRTRWITNHINGQGLNAGRILPKPRTQRTTEETKAYDKARQDFAYHIVRKVKAPTPTAKPKSLRVSPAMREAAMAFLGEFDGDSLQAQITAAVALLNALK